MKKLIKKLNTALTTVGFCLLLSVFASAEGEVKYSNDPTVTPLRIFFAVLIIFAFIVMEIAFEKIREKRIKKRNESYEKRKNK